MSLNNASSGFHNSTPYFFPGIPWCTSSIVNGPKVHHFQKVTGLVLVRNNGSVADSSTGDMWLAFTQNGFSSSHCLKLAPQMEFSAEIRVADIYVSSSVDISYDVFAGLTLIDRSEMPRLTGSAMLPNYPSWDGVG